MEATIRFDTGIPAIGNVENGSHFCHFYRSAEDLAETLVPYFKAGLEANEFCIWVAAEPFPKERAVAALNTAVDGLDRRTAARQIAIYSHEEWYERHRGATRCDVARAWLDAKTTAMADGYRGLRLTGNTAFLEHSDWDGFMEYEAILRESFRSQELIALCSYNTDRCNADAVLDVVRAHDFALSRRKGEWEIVEGANLKASKAALLALNTELEGIIAARTVDLSEALSHQRLLTTELSHRVKNTIASIQSLAEQTLRRYQTSAEARAALRGRLLALGRAHDHLAAGDWVGAHLNDVLASVVAPFGDRIAIEVEDRMLAPRATLSLGLVFYELAMNAAKYGALSSGEGRVRVMSERADDRFEILWTERGGPSAGRPQSEGLGMTLIRQLVAHDLKGECELRFEPQGLTCTIEIPVSEAIAAPTHRCAHVGRA